MKFKEASQPSKQFGMAQSEVADFLNAFPGKKEAAEKLAPLVTELSDLMLNADENGIDTVIRIIDCLRVGDAKGAIRAYEIDGDKLHSHPRIEQWISEKLLPLKNS